MGCQKTRHSVRRRTRHCGRVPGIVRHVPHARAHGGAHGGARLRWRVLRLHVAVRAEKTGVDAARTRMAPRTRVGDRPSGSDADRPLGPGRGVAAATTPWVRVVPVSPRRRRGSSTRPPGAAVSPRSVAATRRRDPPLRPRDRRRPNGDAPTETPTETRRRGLNRPSTDAGRIGRTALITRTARGLPRIPTSVANKTRRNLRKSAARRAARAPRAVGISSGSFSRPHGRPRHTHVPLPNKKTRFGLRAATRL